MFWYCLAYLSCVHLYIMFMTMGYWGADLTAYLMILTGNMSTLAYLYQDGDPEH